MIGHKGASRDDAVAVTIAEPTGSGIYYAHKGSMSCKVTATGKAVHSSVPLVTMQLIHCLNFIINLKKNIQSLKT